ncbi:MAG: QueT transporter family protein, partial [Oscillospiraceae bacterium]|nr:QueT transporter family protein [Oscillospiraceae bacterium]
MTTTKMARGAAIAALYFALTMVLAPLSFGPVQFRVAEALCVLPFLYAEAVPG